MSRVIVEYREAELTVEIATAIAELACLSFQTSPKTVQQRVEDWTQPDDRDSLKFVSGKRFVIWSEENFVLAHARTFIRQIFIAERQLPVLALASVCTHPSVRGKGLGALVTEAAFAQIGLPGCPDVCLFQTPVPQFYERLRSRIVTNRFVNRLNLNAPDANPWRDDTVMIYPSEFDWPEGTVDLNGPDY